MSSFGTRNAVVAAGILSLGESPISVVVSTAALRMENKSTFAEKILENKSTPFADEILKYMQYNENLKKTFNENKIMLEEAGKNIMESLNTTRDRTFTQLQIPDQKAIICIFYSYATLDRSKKKNCQNDKFKEWKIYPGGKFDENKFSDAVSQTVEETVTHLRNLWKDKEMEKPDKNYFLFNELKKLQTENKLDQFEHGDAIKQAIAQNKELDKKKLENFDSSWKDWFGFGQGWQRPTRCDDYRATTDDAFRQFAKDKHKEILQELIEDDAIPKKLKAYIDKVFGKGKGFGKALVNLKDEEIERCYKLLLYCEEFMKGLFIDLRQNKGGLGCDTCQIYELQYGDGEQKTITVKNGLGYDGKRLRSVTVTTKNYKKEEEMLKEEEVEEEEQKQEQQHEELIGLKVEYDGDETWVVDAKEGKVLLNEDCFFGKVVDVEEDKLMWIDITDDKVKKLDEKNRIKMTSAEYEKKLRQELMEWGDYYPSKFKNRYQFFHRYISKKFKEENATPSDNDCRVYKEFVSSRYSMWKRHGVPSMECFMGLWTDQMRKLHGGSQFVDATRRHYKVTSGDYKLAVMNL